MNQILTCYCRSQIFGLSHIFKGSIGYLYATILYSILVTRHRHEYVDGLYRDTKMLIPIFVRILRCHLNKADSVQSCKGDFSCQLNNLFPLLFASHCKGVLDIKLVDLKFG
jgi:hypothetical protein